MSMCVHVSFISAGKKISLNGCRCMEWQNPEVLRANASCPSNLNRFMLIGSPVLQRSGETASTFSTVDWTKNLLPTLGFAPLPLQPAVRSSRPPITAEGDSVLEINALKHPVQPEKAFCAFCLSFNGKEKRPLNCRKPAAEKNLCVNLFSIC